jgi:hypothetical protein
MYAGQPRWLPTMLMLERLARCHVYVVLDNVQVESKPTQVEVFGEKFSIPVVGSRRDPYTKLMFGDDADEAADRVRRRAWGIQEEGDRKVLLELLKRGLGPVRPHALVVPACVEIARYLVEVFSLRTEVTLASSYPVFSTGGDRIVDLCRATGATHYYQGAAIREYGELDKFKFHGIRVATQNVTPEWVLHWPEAVARWGYLEAVRKLNEVGKGWAPWVVEWK